MNLWSFLASELAPTPGRFRATMRVVVACVVAIVIVMGLHVPYGHWSVITIFTVCQTDAGASLRKGIQRTLGTVLAGLITIVCIVAFADQPWMLVPLVGLGCGMALFLSRTTSAPYVGLLLGITFAILLPTGASEADPELALWRILVVTLGVVIATAAQMLLWPDDPAQLLLDDVERILARTEATLERASRGEPTASLDPLSASGLGRHLDLIANAEARHPSLRRRHQEQLSLVTELDRLVTAVLWLAPDDVRAVDTPTAQGLAHAAAACAQLRAALATRTPPAELPPLPARSTDPRLGAMAAGTIEMDRALRGVAATLCFLGTPSDTVVGHPADGGAAPFFTEGFSLQNTEAVRFGLKGALASSIAYVLVQGLAWPGIGTLVATTVIVAQSSTGASTQKGLLRIGGTLLGCFLGIAIIVFAMPRLENLASLLVVMAVGFGIAGWIVVGSPRSAYAGLQTGMALAMYALDVYGPATNLVVGRDRVVGIVAGIIVWMLVDRWLWPVFASREIHTHLAKALRMMATLSRVGLPHGEDALAPSPTAMRRRTVYDELRTVMRLRDEARFEPGANEPDVAALRHQGMRLSADAQTVFLGLLAVGRHRMDVDLGPIPEPLHRPLHVLARAIGDALAAAADRVDGGSGGSIAQHDAAVRNARDRLVDELAAVPQHIESPALAARVALYRAVVPALVRALDTTLALPSPERPSVASGLVAAPAAGT